MKTYTYKIQWLFSVSSGFAITKAQLRKELYQVIRAIGAKSLTAIYGRDKDLIIVWQYTGMVGYSYDTASKETIKRIKKILREDDRINSIELLRR